MWQSVLRIVLALLITAVGASLMIGTVYAKGPVPEQPPDDFTLVIPPLGAEQVLVSGASTTVEYLNEVESMIQVTTEEDVEFFGSPLMSTVTIVCKTPKHTYRYSKYKLEAIMRFCYNTTNPPNIITDYDSFEAISTTSWPHVIISDPWHHKDGGGIGDDYVGSKAKGQFCTPVLQDDDTFECETIYNLYIKMKHNVGGESTGTARVTSQDG